MIEAILNRRQATVCSVVVTILIAVSAPLTAARPEGLLSKKELKLLMANAKTPEDHQKLARHFAVNADRLETESREHERLAGEYRRTRASNPFEMKFPMSPRTAAHCEYFAKQTHKAAQEARRLVARQEEMARQADR
jgi:hypothetical protein